jgi:hypothetical protein
MIHFRIGQQQYTYIPQWHGKHWNKTLNQYITEIINKTHTKTHPHNPPKPTQTTPKGKAKPQ